MRQYLRWALLAVFTILVLPVIQEFAVNFARDWGLYDNPTESASAAWGYIQVIASIPYFESLLTFVGGLTLGVWIDTILRRRPTFKERLATLGERSIKLASNIGVTLSNYGEDELPPSIFAEIRAIYVEYTKVGLPKLGTTVKLLGKTKLELARAFLSHVGPLLRDGHYKEAQRVANKMIENVRSRESPEPQ
jgi:hypothetical protein